MSIKEVSRFMNRLEEDTAFNDRISRAANSGDDTAREEFWALVKEAGFEFTPDDLAAVIAEAESGAAEIPDDELENVAGGGSHIGSVGHFGDRAFGNLKKMWLNHTINPGPPGERNPFGPESPPHRDDITLIRK